MHFIRHFFVALSLIFVLGGRPSDAAEPTPIQLSIEGMHCAGCASKVSKRLQAVAGVASAKVDAPSAGAIVIPKQDSVPSPKALWEAVERSGYKPVKLVTTAGTFTTKPRF